jgi:hypothetical protein
MRLLLTVDCSAAVPFLDRAKGSTYLMCLIIVQLLR